MQQVNTLWEQDSELFLYYTSGTRPRVAVALSGDWLNDIVTLRSSTSLSLPAENNPFTQPIVGLRSRWSSREYDDLSLIFCEALSILAVLYAPI
jgi:hypothetical protein